MGKTAIQEWMPFYGDRFLKDFAVVGMSDTARLLYIVLLWRQWESGGIPSETQVVMRISTLGTRNFTRAWPEVAPMFPVDSDGLRRNQTLAGHRDRALGKIENYRANADRMNQSRSRDSSRDSSRSPSLDGDGELDLQQQQHAGAIAPCTPQQQRLWVLLRLWDAHRTTAMQPAPSPTEALMKSLAKIDRPSRDWESIIRDVTAWPALNGTAPPKPGYPSPYVLTFGKLLTAKIADAAERGEYRNPNKLRSPDMTDGNAEVLRRSVELALEQKARTQ